MTATETIPARKLTPGRRICVSGSDTAVFGVVNAAPTLIPDTEFVSVSAPPWPTPLTLNPTDRVRVFVEPCPQCNVAEPGSHIVPAVGEYPAFYLCKFDQPTSS